MYAVIETGGKQYRVEVGTELEVELLDVEPGQSISLERVLLVADGSEATVGQPVVADAAVKAEVVGRDRADKVIAFKYRPKARRRVKKGHRQDVTLLRIADITFNGRSAAEDEAKAADARRTERQRVEEAAARQAAEDAALAAKLAVGSPKAEAPKRTRAKAAAEPAKGARTTGTSATKAEPNTTAKADEAAPKRPRAKADTTGSTAKTDAAPKRSRTTKKDE
jgi:large subunit ribosomal protein L21